MIIIRHYGKDDWPQVRDLKQRQGLSYDLPNLENPSILVRTVIEENGVITHAAFLRKTSEAYWIFDPKAAKNKMDTIGRLSMLQIEMSATARYAGITDVNAWVPPEVASNVKFDRMMLNKFRWTKPLWTCYNKEL
jgi:hypothetical protein